MPLVKSAWEAIPPEDAALCDAHLKGGAQAFFYNLYTYTHLRGVWYRALAIRAGKYIPGPIDGLRAIESMEVPPCPL